MKKNILLILMFITMFFIGSNEAEALVCQVGQAGCSVTEIQEELKKIQTFHGNETYNELACLYEIKDSETNKKYYSYIYYDVGRKVWFAGTTLNNKIEGYLETIEKDTLNSDVLISQDAYDNLNTNKQCPTNAYIDRQKNEICFDNNSECKNSGEKINNSTNFNLKKGTFESSSPQKFPVAFSYKELANSGYCKSNELPTGYDGICAYVDGKSGDYVYVLYNKTSNRLIYSQLGSDSLIIDDNDLYDKDVRTFKNKIGKINSCPSNIYSNYSEEKNNVNSDGIERIYTFEQVNKNKNTTIYTQISCGNDKQIGETSCESLIDEELAEVINDIMTIISIGVPILLIGLLTYDFAKAVFAGDEKAVKDVKGHAVKRIIIAVIIFFVPTLVNLVFDLVNTVWEKNFEICVIEEK